MNLNLLKSISSIQGQYYKILFAKVSQDQKGLVLPKLQSHRGFWVEGEKENTLGAILQSQKNRARMVEFDVQLSRDHVVILNHDLDLNRIWGVSKKAADCLYSELKQIGVSSLEEILQKTELFLNIEVKSDKVESTGIEVLIAALIEKYDSVNRVVVSSFNPMVLVRMKKLNTQINRALLVSGEREKGNHFYLRQMMFLPLVQPHFINMQSEFITDALLRSVQKTSMQVVAWTVNDLNKIRELLDKGVSSVISDKFVCEDIL